MGFPKFWSKKTRTVPLEIRMVVPALTVDPKSTFLDWEQCLLYSKMGRISDSEIFTDGGKLKLTLDDGSQHSVFIAEVTRNITLKSGGNIDITKCTIYCLLDELDSVSDAVYHEKIQTFLKKGGFGKSPRIPSSFKEHCSLEFLQYHSFSRTIR